MDALKDWLVPLLTFLGTVFAGAGLKWMEGWLKKAKDKDDTATNLRNELRGELTALKAEMVLLEKETDVWREKYYVEKENCMRAEMELEQAKMEIQKKAR